MARTKNVTVKNIKAQANAKAGKTTKPAAKTTNKANATVKKSTKVNKEEQTMAKAKKEENITLTAEEIAFIKELRSNKTNKPEVKETKDEAEVKPFDRERYESVAEALGVLGKHGVYKFARPTVYEVMDKAKITKKVVAEAKAELLEKAKAQGLTWFYETDEVDVEEEEVI